MGTEKFSLEGDALILDGKILHVFGVGGFKDGDSTVMRGPHLLGSTWISVARDSDPAADIAGIINADIEAGNGNKIDHVVVYGINAVLLWVDGVITPDMVREATLNEHGDIILPPATFQTSNGPRKFPIRVARNPKWTMATIDADGNLV